MASGAAGALLQNWVQGTGTRTWGVSCGFFSPKGWLWELLVGWVTSPWGDTSCQRRDGTRAAAALALPHLQASRLQLSFQLLMRRFKSGEPCLGARHLELKVIKGEIFSCNRKYWACGDSIIISVSTVRKPTKQIGFWMKHMERWPMYKTYLDLKK